MSPFLKLVLLVVAVAAVWWVVTSVRASRGPRPPLHPRRGLAPEVQQTIDAALAAASSSAPSSTTARPPGRGWRSPRPPSRPGAGSAAHEPASRSTGGRASSPSGCSPWPCSARRSSCRSSPSSPGATPSPRAAPTRAPGCCGSASAWPSSRSSPSGLMRRPFGITLGWVVQALTWASAVLVPAMLGVALVFTALWVLLLVQGTRVDRSWPSARRRAGRRRGGPSAPAD